LPGAPAFSKSELFFYHLHVVLEVATVRACAFMTMMQFNFGIASLGFSTEI
jgi:hypothetical protein